MLFRRGLRLLGSTSPRKSKPKPNPKTRSSPPKKRVARARPKKVKPRKIGGAGPRDLRGSLNDFAPFMSPELVDALSGGQEPSPRVAQRMANIDVEFAKKMYYICRYQGDITGVGVGRVGSPGIDWAVIQTLRPATNSLRAWTRVSHGFSDNSASVFGSGTLSMYDLFDVIKFFREVDFCLEHPPTVSDQLTIDSRQNVLNVRRLIINGVHQQTSDVSSR